MKKLFFSALALAGLAAGCTTYVPAASAATTVQPSWAKSGYTLGWYDNFTSLSPARWSTSWFNGGKLDLVSTKPSNVAIKNGYLYLTLSDPKTGAAVDTDPKQTGGNGFEMIGDGYSIEARVFFPGNPANKGKTLYNWDAFWLDGENWPADGEVDIAETGSHQMTSNYHGTGVTNNYGPVPGLWGNAWHTYGINRRAGNNVVYWDGKIIRQYHTNDWGAPEYIVFNTGCWSGCTPGAKFIVDWVRTWKDPS